MKGKIKLTDLEYALDTSHAWIMFKSMLMLPTKLLPCF